MEEVFRVISEIHSEGVTVLLIEQNAQAALAIADYGYVMESGTIVLQGNGGRPTQRRSGSACILRAGCNGVGEVRIE